MATPTFDIAQDAPATFAAGTWLKNKVDDGATVTEAEVDEVIGAVWANGVDEALVQVNEVFNGDRQIVELDVATLDVVNIVASGNLTVDGNASRFGAGSASVTDSAAILRLCADNVNVRWIRMQSESADATQKYGGIRVGSYDNSHAPVSAFQLSAAETANNLLIGSASGSGTAGPTQIRFNTAPSVGAAGIGRWYIPASGHFHPWDTNTYDIGTSSLRVREVFGVTGNFSGAVSGTTGTFSAAVSGTTGTFSSDVRASGNDNRFGDGQYAASASNGIMTVTSATGTRPLAIVMANSLTADTNRNSAICVLPYNLAHRPVGLISGTNLNSSNIVAIGTGVTSAADACTQIRFYTASALNTSIGTVRWRIESTGHFQPEVTDTYDIGTSSVRVREVFGVTGNFSAGVQCTRLAPGLTIVAENAAANINANTRNLVLIGSTDATDKTISVSGQIVGQEINIIMHETQSTGSYELSPVYQGTSGGKTARFGGSAGLSRRLTAVWDGTDWQVLSLLNLSFS